MDQVVFFLGLEQLQSHNGNCLEEKKEQYGDEPLFIHKQEPVRCAGIVYGVPAFSHLLSSVYTSMLTVEGEE